MFFTLSDRWVFFPSFQLAVWMREAHWHYKRYSFCCFNWIVLSISLYFSLFSFTFFALNKHIFYSKPRWNPTVFTKSESYNLRCVLSCLELEGLSKENAFSDRLYITCWITLCVYSNCPFCFLLPNTNCFFVFFTLNVRWVFTPMILWLICLGEAHGNIWSWEWWNW